MDSASASGRTRTASTGSSAASLQRADATLAELAAHRDRARAMGGPDRLAAHRGSGKLDARGRIDALLDPGSFREIGTLVGAEVAESLGYGLGKPIVLGSWRGAATPAQVESFAAMVARTEARAMVGSPVGRWRSGVGFGLARVDEAVAGGGAGGVEGDGGECPTGGAARAKRAQPSVQRRKTRQALCPPKPKLFDRTRSNFTVRA